MIKYELDCYHSVSILTRPYGRMLLQPPLQMFNQVVLLALSIF